MNTNTLTFHTAPLIASAYLYPSVADCRRLLSNREAYALFYFFNYETPATIAAKLLMLRAEYPLITFRACVDRPDVFDALRGDFGEVVYAHQNALIDDRVFRPLPDVRTLYNAVYNAGTTSGKRHQLADEIDRWLWITYMPNGAAGTDYFHTTRATLRNVRIPQWAGGRYWYWDNRQIAVCLNEAQVGLCLTAHEGGMWAVSEYGLSGLPVVCTRDGVGGFRSVLPADCTAYCDADPLAVAKAAGELTGRRLPREQVRAATLAVLRPHLQSIQATLQTLYDLAGVRQSVASLWGGVYFDKMYRWQPSPFRE